MANAVAENGVRASGFGTSHDCNTSYPKRWAGFSCLQGPGWADWAEFGSWEIGEPATAPPRRPPRHLRASVSLLDSEKII